MATTNTVQRGISRLRMHWRHEQLTLQMLLATYEHHTAPPGQMEARSGEWEQAVLHGHVPEHPTPQAAGTEYFSLDVEDVPGAGSRPYRLACVRPQGRFQRQAVEQTVNAPLLDSRFSCAADGGTAGGCAPVCRCARTCC